MTQRKKLIEVALPLEAINKESAREKSIRHGHPSTLHLWWARRPLAACRAVLFASLVDDPSSCPEEFPTEEAQQEERDRLFRIIEELVKWENSSNEKVLGKVRREIQRSTNGNPPPVLDPFCGGGSIPLEAQRLGLEAHGGDLNPVAVLITKALIEIPPRFAGRPPLHPDQDEGLVAEDCKGARGLAEDVRYYGRLMREEAEKRIGHLYPQVRFPQENGGAEATVIAWLWARTVTCPNPACGAEMPLVRSFWLSKKKDKKAWVEPVVDRANRRVDFEVRTGEGVPREGTVNRQGAHCIVCDSPVPFKHVRAEGKAGRMSSWLMAVVVEGNRGRVYLPPDEEYVRVAESAEPEWQPDSPLPDQALGFRVQQYGMTEHADLFTPRQLVALTTFSDLVSEMQEKVRADAVSAGMADDEAPFEDGGTGARAYGEAVGVYLGFAVSRLADRGSSICSWDVTRDNVRNTFARQAIPMVWDYAEANPFSESTGNFGGAINWIAKAVQTVPASPNGRAIQVDAVTSLDGVEEPLVSTDPPYYDNIGYADLADFFYVWLRRSLNGVFPELFGTLLTPKGQELVATPYRFDGDKGKAERFFESGLQEAFAKMRAEHNPDYPLTVFYAFKQAEKKAGQDLADALVSTGWETMLQGLLGAGFVVDGTWPMRSELSNRPVASGTNALASSIVFSCRPRPDDAPLATRRDFQAKLKEELPPALKTLQSGNIAPVDLDQAAIGPGMAVFSRYAKVLEPDGSAMTVRAALSLINQALDEVLAEQEAEYDAETRWAVSWFETYGVGEGPYGTAETLSKAKNTAVDALVEAGILESKAGRVRLLDRSELYAEWDPSTDGRLTVWEVTQYLIRTLADHGEEGAAQLARRVGSLGEVARDLSYRLFTVSERNKWTEEALAYNTLVVSWPEIARLASGTRVEPQEQIPMEGI